MTDWPTDQPTNQPTDQPTDRLTYQPTNWPTDQPTNQPTNQQTDRLTDWQTDWLTDWLEISVLKPLLHCTLFWLWPYRIVWTKETFQNGWWKGELCWFRSILQRELWPTTTGQLPVYHLCGSCSQGSLQIRSMITFWWTVFSLMNKKGAGKVLEAQKISYWLIRLCWKRWRGLGKMW